MYLITKITSIKGMEVIAPVSGGGAFAALVEWAPVISIFAALTGIILGILSFLLKVKQHRLETEFYLTKTRKLKEQYENSKH